MTTDQFDRQINRLMTTYGKQHYGEERIKLLWKDIQEYDVGWFARVIDSLLAEHRQAPLLSDIREHVSRERERLWAERKKQHTLEAEEFMSIFDDESRGSMMKTIIDRLHGRVDNPTWESFIRGIGKLGQTKCKTCDDVGMIFFKDAKNYEWPYRCLCEEGGKHTRAIPRIHVSRFSQHSKLKSNPEYFQI